MATSSEVPVHVSSRYKWAVLGNTTLGMLMATINSSIVLISLPAIFHGIHLNPLQPSNVTYLLWMLMGFLLVTAVFVVTFGRLGDMFGRVRIYNAGFLIFAIAAVALSLVPWDGGAGAWWLIAWRGVQGIGAAMIMANSTAILTDAFPITQRGMAIGINQVAAVAGGFIGLVIGGLLANWHWRAVFWVSVPFGVIGAIWAYAVLKDSGVRHKSHHLDVAGNVTFAFGLGLLIAAVTYGLQPYGGHTMGWTSPTVLTMLIGGLGLLIAFGIIERRSPEPMFHMDLFGIKAFSWGNLAGLMSAMSRGGLQLILIVWLQGIWLPHRGFSYESAPFWAAIFLIPLTVGFLIAGPAAGWLSDRHGPRTFAIIGALVTAASFIGLMVIPVDFPYWIFAVLTFVNGFGSGMFTSPNATVVMNSVPANQRGAASGMRMTSITAGSALSIGLFFSLLVIGLSGTLPTTMTAGLTAHGVPMTMAHTLGSLPPVGILFAAFLGINPIAMVLGPTGLLHSLPGHQVSILTGNDFFPALIAKPFQSGLLLVFGIAATMMIVAAVASWFAGDAVHAEVSQADAGERLGEEPEDYRLVEGDLVVD